MFIERYRLLNALSNLYGNVKYYRYHVIMRPFIDAFGAISHFCMDNIRQRKRLPEKVVQRDMGSNLLNAIIILTESLKA